MGNDGDIVVPVASALADDRQGALHAGPGAGSTTLNCGSIPASDISWYHESLSLKAPAPPVTCWHLTETTDARWQGDTITAIKAYLAARLTPPCTSAALSSALRAANEPLLLPGNWVVQDYACQSGYALAELGGNGYPVDAVFKQQGASWTFVYVLGEFNYCLTEQNGSIIHSCKGGPSQALLQSLTQKANSSSVTPEFYVHNGYELGSLYKYPDFPARIGLNNGAYLSSLQWTQVGPRSATATGTLNVNNCIPGCAAGTYVQYSVRLLASDPRQCNVAVYAPYSDVSQEVRAYVFNQIQVAALSGNPPSAYVGTSPPDLPPACG